MSLQALAWAWELEGLDPTEKLVLLALADAHHEASNLCFPSRTTLCRRVGVHLDTVKRVLRRLEDKRLILRQPVFDAAGRQQTNRYVLVSYRGCVDAPPEGAAGAPPEGCADAPQNGKKEREEGTPPPLPPRKRGGEVTDRSREILAVWNEIAGQHLRAVQWLRKIEARCKTFPELGIADHERVIRAAFAKPWWKGAATPNVVYGTDAQFERSLLAVDQQTHRTKTEEDARERIARVLARRAA